MQLETHEQIVVANWLREQGIFFTASAGGARTSIGTGKKLKMMGYKRGCPDLLIFEPRMPWHGLFVELKRSAVIGHSQGRPTPEQKEFEVEAIKRGYQFRFAYGSDDAITMISKYLNGDL